METIPLNPGVERLRQTISTCHFLGQAQRFNLITSKEYGEYIKKLNDETHKIINEIISTISGDVAETPTAIP